jgi:Tol biopolymer transport system component
LLVYQAAPPVAEMRLVWYDRSGKPLGSLGEPGPYLIISLARDSRSVLVAYRRPSPVQSNIWSYAIDSGVKTRLTFGDTRDHWPVLSPDGQQLIYTSMSSRPQPHYAVRLRDLASGKERTLIESSDMRAPTDWSTDGRSVLITGMGGLSRGDIWSLSVSDGKVQPYLQTLSTDTYGRFSPDGKWVAYQSDEAGPQDVYLAPFPPTGARWQVSDNGGISARWRADGKELYYVADDGRVMAVSVRLGATPVLSRPIPLFRIPPGTARPYTYDASGDGQRFLVSVGGDQPQPLTVVTRFDNELRAAARRK